MHLHAFIFFSLDVSTLVLEAIVIDGNKSKLENVDTLDKNIKNHFIIGCAVLAILIVQHIGGVILKHGIEGTNKHVGNIKIFH